jgi:hypothetical protein
MWHSLAQHPHPWPDKVISLSSCPHLALAQAFDGRPIAFTLHLRSMEGAQGPTAVSGPRACTAVSEVERAHTPAWSPPLAITCERAPRPAQPQVREHRTALPLEQGTQLWIQPSHPVPAALPTQTSIAFHLSIYKAGGWDPSLIRQP